MGTKLIANALLALVLSLPGAVQAEDEGTFRVAGRVSSIDRHDRTLRVKERTLQVPERFEAFQRLHTGLMVILEVQQQGEALVVTELEIFYE